MTGKEGEHYILRLSNVNSQEELRDYVFASDSLDLEDISSLQGVTYLQRDALYSMPYIIPLLDRNDIDYDISLTEDFNWDLFENHIIYSGVFQ